MKIGYACIPLMTPHKTTRKLTLSNYNSDKLNILIKENLDDLYSILIYNKLNDISLFRISSDIIPLGSHNINKVLWWENFSDKLSEIASYIAANNLRVSMHPGQYTVINSPKTDVVKKSILDLEYHCRFLDSLNLPSSHKIILHVGGLYGNKKEAIIRFINEYNSLPNNVKNRLVIENDERFFSIYDLLEINSKTNIPLIFDNLHYECFGDFNLPLNSLLKMVKSTWRKDDGDMKIHYSQQHPNKKTGAHGSTTIISDFLDFLNEFDFSNIDIMLEVKDKDVSALKAIKSINELKNKKITYPVEELNKYKLFLYEKLGNDSNPLIESLISENSYINFYSILDNFIYTNLNQTNFKLALDKAFSSVKTDLNNKEISHYQKLYNSKEYLKCKEYLKKLSDKYSLDLTKTYYFIY